MRTFTEAWERREELDSETDVRDWISGIAVEVLAAHRRATPETTGRAAPRNLRIVVDDAAVERIRGELLADDAVLPVPPARVWRAIERRVPGAAVVASNVEGQTHPTAAVANPTSGEELLRVTATRRPRRLRWLILAIAAALVAAGVAIVSTQRRSGELVVATAVLHPVNGVDVGLATGSVTLQRAGTQHSLRIRLEVPPALPPGTSYQLALVDGRGTRRVVGRISAAVGDVDKTMPLPDGLDTSAFRTVDLSIHDDDLDASGGLTPIMGGTLRS